MMSPQIESRTLRKCSARRIDTHELRRRAFAAVDRLITYEIHGYIKVSIRNDWLLKLEILEHVDAYVQARVRGRKQKEAR